jgi:hypothetical protein
MAPDHINMELYIVCTAPYMLIWVRPTIPAQLFVLKGTQSEELLLQAGDFYRDYVAENQQKQ